MRNYYPVLLCLGLGLFFKPGLFAQCPDAVDAGPDLRFCLPAPQQAVLDAKINAKYLFYEWVPKTGLVNPTSLTPTVLISKNTSYILYGYVFGNNMTINGAFEEGPHIPYTGLTYSPGDISKRGTYDVVSNTKPLDPTFPGCTDHSGKGNMLVFRGDPTIKAVWCQTFDVEPYTGYTMSLYTTVIKGSSPHINFSAPGLNVTKLTPIGGSNCKWEQQLFVWGNDINTSVDVCITFPDMTPDQVIAIDDIEFYPSCLRTDTVDIFLAPEVKAIASPPYQGIISCKGGKATLSGQGSSTGPNFSYQWETADGHIVSGHNTLSPVVDAAGTYTLTVTYDDGLIQCTKTASSELAYTNPMQAYVNPAAELNCEVKVVSLIGGATLPGPNMYQWTASNGGHIVSGENTFLAKADQPGEYALVVTNLATGCTAEANAIVYSNTTPPKALATAPALLCSENQTTLSGFGSSSGPNFTYIWTSPDSSGHIVSGQDSIYALADAPGMYILSVTNKANKCTAADTVMVTLDTLLPEATILPSSEFNCITDTVVLSAVVTPADALFSWSAAGGGNIAGDTDTSIVVVTTPAVYKLTVTNPINGCTAVVSDTIGLNDIPPVAAIQSPESITCQQSSVMLSGTGSSAGGGIEYSWTTSGGGNIVSGSSSLNPVVNAAGTYTLLVTKTTNGCTALASITVEADTSAVVAVANAPSPLTCIAGTAMLNANGSTSGPSISYLWTTVDGTILEGANSPTPLVGATGTYTLLITNTASGCSSTDLAVLTADIAAPGAALTVSGNLNCNNTSVELKSASIANPNLLDHFWTAPDNSTIGTNTTSSLQVNAPGNYTLVVTNTQNGCTSSASIGVIARENVAGAVISQSDIDCFGASNGTLQASASGGDGNFTYLWSNDQTTPALSGLAPGAYTLTVTDGEGCSSSVSATITQADELVVSSTSTPPSVAGGANGSATVNPSGGTPGYTYLWPNNEMTQSVSGLRAGNYVVTITDTRGCTVIHTVVVDEGVCNLLADFSTVHPLCFGTASGQATVLVLGGTGPFEYAWSNNNDQPTATGLAAGTYTVVVTDVNNCEITGSVTLTDPPLLTLELVSVVNTSCALSEEGSATVLSVGGSGAVAIVWSNNQTGGTANNLPAGAYIATATDANGCTATTEAIVESIDQTPPQIQINSTTLALGPSGSITLTLLNSGVVVVDNCAVASASFSPASFDCNDLGAQQVTVTAFDGSGNSSSAVIDVTVIDNIAPGLVCADDIVRCAGDDVVEYNAPVATDNCLGLGGQFNLAAGLPSGSAFPPGATINTYTFADAQGNVGDCSFVVTILSPLVSNLDSIIHDTDNKGIGGVQVSVSGGQPGYTYAWMLNGQTIATTEDLSGVGAGTYTLLVTDQAGCTAPAGPFMISNVSGTTMAGLTGLVGVFPNPTTGQLFAAFPAELAGTEKYFTLFDATGRKVMELRDDNRQQVTLDLSKLPEGLYSVLIRTMEMQGVWNIVVNR